MFPYMERRGKKVDAYGETLDVGQWVRKGREIEEEGETKEVSDAKKKKEEEGEKAVSVSSLEDHDGYADKVAKSAGASIKIRIRYQRC